VRVGQFIATALVAAEAAVPSWPSSLPPAITMVTVSATNATTAASVPSTTRTEGNVTFGNGSGDTSSGIRAILGFEHAYYSERSATRAHTFVAPGANVEPPVDLQKTIDQHIPRGTAYCLRIAEMAPDRFNVELTERRPDGTEAKYFPVITTVNLDGRTLIYLID
jgi:hypothetical protein